VSFLSIGGMIGIAATLTQIILVVLFILLAIHLIINTHPLQRLTGWFFLIGSVIIVLMQFMGILGFIKMAA
jgi:succinate-acetate transporter protein